MSVFMVSPEHIGLIADYCRDQLPVLRAVRDTGYTIDRIGVARALHDMNVCALVARYGVDHGMGYPFEDPPRAPSFVESGHLGRQIDCYLHQCSEGDVNESPLFLALDNWRDASLPTDTTAPWGI